MIRVVGFTVALAVVTIAPAQRVVGAAETLLHVNGRSNSTPTIATSGSVVAIAWGAALPSGATDVFTAMSHDSGRTFDAPVRVNDVDGDARLNGEQPPHIGLIPQSGRDPQVVVVWTTKGEKGTVLRQARSIDAGRSFSRSSIVPGSDADGNRGWEAINVEPTGRVDVVWLDHRELASDSNMAAMHHQHASSDKPDGVAMAQKSKLYFASLDASAPPAPVTGGVCYCCKTALATAADGTIFTAWRHVYPGNLRDMAFSMSHDRGRSFAAPVRVSQDGWMLEGCHDDGPSLAVDARSRVHMVWPTLVPAAKGADPTIGIFYSSTADGTRFTPRERIPAEGTPHHPRVVVSRDGTLVAAWDESQNGRRRIAIARASTDENGRRSFKREVITSNAPGVYPALAATHDAVVVAWTSGASADSSIHVMRLAPRAAGTEHER